MCADREFYPWTRGTLSEAESGHLPFRQVSWLCGLGLCTVSFPPEFRQWIRAKLPLTVALPRRSFTAFPILPRTGT